MCATNCCAEHVRQECRQVWMQTMGCRVGTPVNMIHGGASKPCERGLRPTGPPAAAAALVAWWWRATPNPPFSS